MHQRQVAAQNHTPDLIEYCGSNSEDKQVFCASDQRGIRNRGRVTGSALESRFRITLLCPEARVSFGYTLNMVSKNPIGFLAVVVYFIVTVATLTLTARADETPATAAICTNCNVLLISVDTLRADHLGSYGYPKDTTPFIDRFSAQSILFEQMETTRALTWPSFASLFTSLYPMAHNVRSNGHVLDDDIPILSELMQRSGYHTAAFVANYCAMSRHHFDTAMCGKDAALTNRMREFLGKHRKDRFFAWLHYMAPHAPFAPPAPFDLFTDENYAGELDGGSRTLGTAALRSDALPNADLEHVVGRYDGEIRFTDSLIESVLEVLDGTELAERTVVIITSDHGEELFDHHRHWYHQCSIYGTTLHIPFILRLPNDHMAGSRIRSVVEIIDVAPTLLELTGIEAPVSFAGRSLVPLITNEDRPEENDYAFSELIPGPVFTVRSNTWRYIYNPTQTIPQCSPRGGFYRVEEEELYDVMADPLEQLNVIKEHPEIAKELRGVLLEKFPVLNAAKKPVMADEQELEQLRALGYLP